MSSPSNEPDVASASGSRVWILFRNAVANVLRAFSSTAVTVLLPLLLVVIFQPERYAAWALVFSLGAFVAYWDLGLPTTVQAMVGRHMATDGLIAAGRVARSGITLALLISGLCLAASALAAVGFAGIFPAVPLALQNEARGALVLIVLGQVGSLVGNIIAAYFAGQQRSHIPALIVAPARVLSLVMAIVAAVTTHSLVVTAVGYALPLVIGTVTLASSFVVNDRIAGRGLPTPKVDAGTTNLRSLLSYSGPLIVWSICMLVTTGLDLIIVARVDYGAIVPYSIAAVVVSAVAGLESATTGPLLPELARAHTLQGSSRVSQLAERFNSVNAVLLFAVTGVLIAAGPVFLPLLAHSSQLNLHESWPILAVLLSANALHLIGTPLSLTFIATKTHTRVIWPPVIEAGLNLGLSVWLGILFGAIGVALGTLIASTIGIVLGYFWSVRVSGVIRTRPSTLFLQGAVRPLAAVLPVIIVTAIAVALNPSRVSIEGLGVITLSVVASLILLWRLGLDAGSRAALLVRVRSRIRRIRA